MKPDFAGWILKVKSMAPGKSGQQEDSANSGERKIWFLILAGEF